MSIPIIFAAGAGLALLFAGSKDGEKGAAGTDRSSGGPASPTQASTGGEGGGAQYPSHADGSATSDQVATATTAPDDTKVQLTPSVDNGFLKDAVAGYQAGSTSTSDPWAQAYPVSKTSPSGQLGVVAGSTVKATGEIFEKVGDAFGWIW